MEFELGLKGPFWVEISSNGPTLIQFVGKSSNTEEGGESVFRNFLNFYHLKKI